MLKITRLINGICICLLICTVSCKVGKYNRGTVNNPENYQAKYKDNGGKMPTLFFNKGKVVKETQYMTALAILKKAREDGGKPPKGKRTPKEVGKIDSTEVVIDMVSAKIQEEIDELYKEFEKIDPLDDNAHKTILEVLTKVNDLYYKKINPYKILKNKSVNTLSSDLSFNTGKSKLIQEGYTEINALIKKIEHEILDWKAYVDDHNNEIFATDRFKITIHINGYADKQGSSENNQKLSTERAEEVREAFVIELKKLSANHSLVYSVNFEGKGEELPPGTMDTGKDNDPKRRVCVITSVVGPMKLITAK